MPPPATAEVIAEPSVGSNENAPIDVDAADAPVDATAPAVFEDAPMPADASGAIGPATAEDAAADVLAQLLDIRRNVMAFRKELEDLKAEHARVEKESDSKIMLEQRRLQTMTTALNKSLLV